LRAASSSAAAARSRAFAGAGEVLGAGVAPGLASGKVAGGKLEQAASSKSPKSANPLRSGEAVYGRVCINGTAPGKLGEQL
jgi:hypothetical protein